jgi:hypothetical protein
VASGAGATVTNTARVFSATAQAALADDNAVATGTVEDSPTPVSTVAFTGFERRLAWMGLALTAAGLALLVARRFARPVW